jgi:hypothetical protein
MNRRVFLASTVAGTAAFLARPSLGTAKDDHHHFGVVHPHNTVIHTTNTHEFRVQTNGNSVLGVNAIHKQSGQVQAHDHKVGSARRPMPDLSSVESVSHVVFGAQEVATEGSLAQVAIAYVGFWFQLLGQVYIFWWPVALVNGGAAGVVIYP